LPSLGFEWVVVGCLFIGISGGRRAQADGEPAATAGNAGANGAGREVEDLRNFGVVEPGMVAQYDRGSEILGQRREGVVDHQAVDDLLGDPRRRVGAGSFEEARCFIDVGRRRSSPLAAKFVEARIGGDAV